MRPFLFAALLIVSSLSFSSALAQTSAQKKLVVLGDSVSEGYGVAKDAAYPVLLEKKLHEAGKKEWTVFNASVSGSTTASGIGRMKWIFKSKPDAVFLALGANDGLRGLKVDESEKNLASAIEYAQAQKVRVILGGLYMPPNYGKDYSDKFKKMYESLAKKYKLTFVPFILDKVAGNPKYNLADGIHPNEEGHKIIADTVFTALKGSL
ncbi:arylesterase [Bdellovibrio svalbardensis]|uniref:Arylesterase n=1 Tax=Bdellovibrio svalbardensis TaxID=2972972 RepID=A0ABT6DM74_9BACT|nr:arylesterase [Bdellovibrio svalbardensis]MDG0817175.1 arylesterase [Bdellovibrio svalbardensis]